MRGILRLVKFLLVAAIIGGALLVASYVGARATAGKLLGPEPPIGGRVEELAWRGAEELPGNPRVWVFTYRASRLPGIGSARIYVSLTGHIVSMMPPDLDVRLEAWEKTRHP